MADMKIKLNSKAIRQLLKSPEVKAVLDAEAERMTRATGVEYRSDVYPGRYRLRASAATRAGEFKTISRLSKKRSKYEKNRHKGKTKSKKKGEQK